jgi:hypothetical protein
MSAFESPNRQPKAALADAMGVAKMLAIDVSEVWKGVDAGQILAPFRVCDQDRWSISELHEWIAAHCPNQAAWNRLKVKGRSRPATRTHLANFNIPKAGTGVFHWAKQMEKAFETRLVDGMARDAEEKNWGGEFAEWSQDRVQVICMKAIEFIRALPTYEGQYDYLLGDSPSSPPW